MENKSVHTDDERGKQLQSWAEAAEAEIQELTAAMIPLQQKLQAARERLDLIHRLARLENPGGSETSIQADAAGKGSPSVLVSFQPSADVEDHLEAILAESGRPMHIRDLRKALIERGVPLPGRGEEANIILRLGRAKDRFVRTGRGQYGLPKWGIESVPLVQRKKRIYRRRKAT